MSKSLSNVILEILAFIIMLVFGDETINDFAGGSNFLILALVTLTLSNTYYTRNIIVSVMVMVGQGR
jgi:steroid 5-alpha reductase family enzyme